MQGGFTLLVLAVIECNSALTSTLKLGYKMLLSHRLQSLGLPGVSASGNGTVDLNKRNQPPPGELPGHAYYSEQHV